MTNGRGDTIEQTKTAGATAALALFGSMGYQPIDAYNGNPYASYRFEEIAAALG